MKKEIVEDLENLKNYSWLPKRIEGQLSTKTEDYKKDEFGVKPRLDLIKNKLLNLNVKDIVDLGGNSGFFSLELLDGKIITSSSVYDVDEDVLNFGKKIADQMQLESFIKFIKKSVSLNNLNEYPNADAVLCLNLIHHAGVLFDVDLVKKMGWSKYSLEFLKRLRKKYKYAVLGVGFKASKPTNWSVPDPLRPVFLADIIRKSGWEITYDANINDLKSLGEGGACGKRTKKTFMIRLAEAIYYVLGYKLAKILFNVFKDKNLPKIDKYHIYILR